MWQGHLPVTLLTSGKVYALKDNHAEFLNDSLEFLEYFDLFFFFYHFDHFFPKWSGDLRFLIAVKPTLRLCVHSASISQSASPVPGSF